MSPGKQFRQMLKTQSPLKIPGVMNAYSAMMAEQIGFKALYLSGAGVANYSYGLPDLGLTGLQDVLVDVRRLRSACDLPLLVDCDTGFGASALNIARTVKEMEAAGVAAIHLEDQVPAKRCGHRPGKQLVSSDEMQARIRTAVSSWVDPDFVIMARTDAAIVEGLDSAIVRAKTYLEVGADMIFAEGLTNLDEFKKFTQSLDAPVLANMTEFGKTPYLTFEEFQSTGIAMILYPLSAARAMQKAGLDVFKAIKEEGSQQSQLDKMQTRDELYAFLDYTKYEAMIDDSSL